MLAAFALAACLAVGAGQRSDSGGRSGRRVSRSGPPFRPRLRSLWLPPPACSASFALPELRRLAERWNLSPAPDREVCVTRPVAVFDADRLLAAMQKELPAAHIELLDFSRLPAPEGELVFPALGLAPDAGRRLLERLRHATPASTALRSGRGSRYRSPRRAWSPRKTSSPAFRWTPRSFAWKRGRKFPPRASPAPSRKSRARVSRRAIAAGAALRTEWLEPAKVGAARRDRAGGSRSTVRHGSSWKASPKASGAIGETIPVQNPVSKQRFQARVEVQRQSRGRRKEVYEAPDFDPVDRRRGLCRQEEGSAGRPVSAGSLRHRRARPLRGCSGCHSRRDLGAGFAPGRCGARPQSQPDRRHDHRSGGGERFGGRQGHHQNGAHLQHQELRWARSPASPKRQARGPIWPASAATRNSPARAPPAATS